MVSALIVSAFVIPKLDRIISIKSEILFEQPEGEDRENKGVEKA